MDPNPYEAPIETRVQPGRVDLWGEVIRFSIGLLVVLTFVTLKWLRDRGG